MVELPEIPPAKPHPLIDLIQATEQHIGNEAEFLALYIGHEEFAERYPSLCRGGECPAFISGRRVWWVFNPDAGVDAYLRFGDRDVLLRLPGEVEHQNAADAAGEALPGTFIPRSPDS